MCLACGQPVPAGSVAGPASAAVTGGRDGAPAAVAEPTLAAPVEHAEAHAVAVAVAPPTSVPIVAAPPPTSVPIVAVPPPTSVPIVAVPPPVDPGSPLPPPVVGEVPAGAVARTGVDLPASPDSDTPAPVAAPGPAAVSAAPPQQPPPWERSELTQRSQPSDPSEPGTCPHCGAPLGMAPADTISNSTISVGFVGSGRGSKAGLAITDAHGTTLFTEDGVVRRLGARQLRQFSPMRGLTSMTSTLGAALMTLEHLPVPALANSVAIRTALQSSLVGDDLMTARRAASDLAGAGVPAPIARLPLAPSEVHWWSALAELRIQQFDAAVTHLAALPLGAYAPAVGLLVLCTGAPIAAVSRRARTVLESRLLAVDASSPLAGAATIAGRRTPLIDWLVHPTPFSAIADLPIDVSSHAVDVLRALAGRGDRDEPIVLPASAKPGVIDDLLDRHYRIADESLRRLDRERVMYITARTRPEALTDDEVEELDFEEEHDRRLLQAGRIADPTPEHPDTPLIGAIRLLVGEHRSSPELRERIGPMGDALAAFLADPSGPGLIDAITDDESLWVLLERTLTDSALEWDPAEGGSARRFLAWWACRLTQRRLHAGDLLGALAAAQHAVRLAAAGPARLEALNTTACTHWLLGRDQDARECLLEARASGMGHEDIVDANLAVVAAGSGRSGRRHPHVILGLPTGAERATAERAFATRSRMARRDPQFAFSTNDLIWALDQIETAIDDPEHAEPVFQMPIDARVLQVPTGHGLLRPAPQPLGRRTAATSDSEINALIAEARSDALLHVLKGAGAEARRTLGAGRDAPPPRPSPLTEYPRQRTSRLPQYLIGILVVVGGVTAALLVLRDKRSAGDDGVAATTVPATAAAIPTVPPSTAVPTTAAAPIVAVGSPIVVNGTSITPVEPVDAFGYACVVFQLTGDGPLGFVPANLTLVWGARTATPALEVVTGRGTSEVVYGETGSVVREVCFEARGWRESVTDLLYDTGSGEVRWRINDPAG